MILIASEVRYVTENFVENSNAKLPDIACVEEVKNFVHGYAVNSKAETVVYSALFGSYDACPTIKAEPGFEYIMFTDRPVDVPKPWKTVRVELKDFCPQRANRYFKTLSHILFPNAKRSLYFDASFSLVSPLLTFVQEFGHADFALFAHPERDDIEQEANACIEQNKDSSRVIRDQLGKYRRDGLEAPSSCFSGGVLLRSHSSTIVSKVNLSWCEEIVLHSVRDQISLPYVFWKNDFLPYVIPGNIFYNRFLVPRPHAQAPSLQRFKRFVALYLFRTGLYRR